MIISEIKLWAAVLEQAIIDYYKKKLLETDPLGHKKWKKYNVNSIDPEWWIFKERFLPGRTPLQSFEGLCLLFEFEPNAIRKAVKDNLKRKEVK